jgi:hypothetical protein
VFDLDDVKADAIRRDNTYGGTRIKLVARIGSARSALQIDVGFGDAVTPGPQIVAYPTLLGDFPVPVLRVYLIYTVIAEKYQAMVMLGQANSRMKDFFDLAVTARRTELNDTKLAEAIAATFARRQTVLPTERPIALTTEFSADISKQRVSGLPQKNPHCRRHPGRHRRALGCTALVANRGRRNRQPDDCLLALATLHK